MGIAQGVGFETKDILTAFNVNVALAALVAEGVGFLVTDLNIDWNWDGLRVVIPAAREAGLADDHIAMQSHSPDEVLDRIRLANRDIKVLTKVDDLRLGAFLQACMASRTDRG